MRNRQTVLLLLLLLVLLMSGAGVALIVLWSDEPNIPQATATAESESRYANSGQPLVLRPSEPEPAAPAERARPPASDRSPDNPTQNGPSGPVAHGYPEPVEVKYGTRASGHAKGIVTFGKVVDENDVPVPEANIVMYVSQEHENGRSNFGGRVISKSNRDGRFSLRVLHQGYAGTNCRFVVVASKEGFTQSTILIPDPDQPITLKLKPYFDRTTIEGEVLDPAGNPLAHRKAWVHGTSPVFDPESFARLPEDLQKILRPASTVTWLADAWTDKHGRFTLPVKGSGTVTVWAGEGDLEKAEDRIEVEPTGNVVNSLPRPITLSK